MCVVSAIFDYGRQRIPMDQWTPDAFDQFKKVVKAAERFDEAAGQPDCEDLAKAAWMREVERRLKALEDKVGSA